MFISNLSLKSNTENLELNWTENWTKAIICICEKVELLTKKKRYVIYILKKIKDFILIRKKIVGAVVTSNSHWSDEEQRLAREFDKIFQEYFLLRRNKQVTKTL